MIALHTLGTLRDTYQIEALPSGRGYCLRGPRGAFYGLLRNAKRPALLFPVNMKGTTLPESLRGKWFTDAEG